MDFLPITFVLPQYMLIFTILTPITPNREINLANKIIVLNNSNIVAEKGIKKPELLNFQFIDKL